MRISDWSSDVCSSDLGGKPINHDMLLDPKRSCAPFCQSREREGPSSLSPTLAAVLSALTGWRACVHRIPPPVWLCLPSCQPIIPKQRGVSPWEIGRASCRQRVCQYV